MAQATGHSISPEQLQRRYHQNLQLLHQTIESTPFAGRYGLFGGLLLGLIRDGEPLSNDWDADFYYLDRDDDLFSQATISLTLAGFKPLYRFRANDGQFWEYTFLKDRAKFEFFRCHPIGNGELRYYDFVPMPPPRQQLLRYYDGPMRSLEFLGCDWLIAGDVDAGLTMHYGDWRTPDRSWRWDNDPQALEIEPWRFRHEMRWSPF